MPEVTHYSFLRTGMTIIETHDKLKGSHLKLYKTIAKLNKLGYEISVHPSYSPDVMGETVYILEFIDSKHQNLFTQKVY